jgi:hypothetical protein
MKKQAIIILAVVLFSLPQTKAVDPALDDQGHVYQWTQRYIEKAAGARTGGLINPHVIEGPDPAETDGQQCWVIKVAFHVEGDNNQQHVATVFITKELGPGHVIGCSLDE